MNTDAIHEAFETLINERGVHNKLGITSEDVRFMRYKLKNDQPIKIETKLKLLQKSGWQQDQARYTREDLVSLLNFFKSTSQAARDNGPEYVIEKWEKRK